MWIYAAFTSSPACFVLRRMPELTGRSLEQIEGSLSAGHFRPDDFAEHTAKEQTAAAKVKVAA